MSPTALLLFDFSCVAHLYVLIAYHQNHKQFYWLVDLLQHKIPPIENTSHFIMTLPLCTIEILNDAVSDTSKADSSNAAEFKSSHKLNLIHRLTHANSTPNEF